jgi:hypothetical protein
MCQISLSRDIPGSRYHPDGMIPFPQVSPQDGRDRALEILPRGTTTVVTLHSTFVEVLYSLLQQ